MYCPIIKGECIKEKCGFWQGFLNGIGKQDFNCTFKWQNVLMIELIQAIKEMTNKGVN